MSIELVNKPKEQLILNPLYVKPEESQVEAMYKQQLEEQKNQYESQISKLEEESVYTYLNHASTFTSPLLRSEKIQALKPYSFADVYIEEMDFPNLSKLGSQAFALAHIKKPFDLPKVTKISFQCFYNTSFWHDEEVCFSNIQEVEGFAFHNSVFYAMQLSKLSLPKAITLGNQAIYNAMYLQAVDFPLVESLGENCIAHNDYLQSIILPSLKSPLVSKEFAYNSSLTKIDLGKNFQEIKPSSHYYTPFYNDSKLETLILRSPTLVTTTLAAKKTSGLFYGGKVPYIYVPKALVEDYKVATNWAVAADYFRAIEDYPEICEVEENAEN